MLDAKSKVLLNLLVYLSQIWGRNTSNWRSDWVGCSNWLSVWNWNAKDSWYEVSAVSVSALIYTDKTACSSILWCRASRNDLSFFLKPAEGTDIYLVADVGISCSIVDYELNSYLSFKVCNGMLAVVVGPRSRKVFFTCHLLNEIWLMALIYGYGYLLLIHL